MTTVLRALIVTTLLNSCRAPAPAPAPVDAGPERRAAFSFKDAGPAELGPIIHAPGAAATLVNVWATWCEPCVAEFPGIVATVRRYEARGVRPVLISGDFEENRAKAEAFLKGHALDFPTWRKTGDDQAFIEAVDPRWTGSLPVTVLLDRTGKARFFREGTVTAEELASELDKILVTN